MIAFSTIKLLILAYVINSSLAAWTWVNHGKPPVFTGLAGMRSGHTTKLFGVGNGILRERYWNGNSWVWTNHGAPLTGMLAWERLYSTPCVLTDGKLFIITNKGRLVERVWHSGSWHWAHHGKPAGLTYGLQKIRCTTTTYNNIHRVFMVGSNRLYERYWSSLTSNWQWRNHGAPWGTQIGAMVDSCNQPSCLPRVYFPGSNGHLYSLNIANGMPGTATWQWHGQPSGKPVRSVTVSNHGAGTFITTSDNTVCRHLGGVNSFSCYGKPSGSGNNHNVALSKAVLVNGCNSFTSNSQYIFMHSWEPQCGAKARFWSLRVSGTNSPSWYYHGNVCSNSYVESPEAFLSGNCPKVFSTRSDGNVRELFWN